MLDQILSGEMKAPAPEMVREAIRAQSEKTEEFTLGEEALEFHENLAYNMGKRYTIDDYYKLPDVMIICNRDKIHPKRIEGAPDFICEVVSPSTASNDYLKKAAKYKVAGVREYWIIDPAQRKLTLYEYQKDDIPQVHSLQGSVGVKIYQDELKIDLDEVAAIVQRGF